MVQDLSVTHEDKDGKRSDPETLKIAVWHNLPAGGGKRALFYHVKGLVERGHSVEVWRPPTADQAFLPLSQLVPEHVVPLDWDANKRRSPIARAREVVDMLRAMEQHCQQCAEEIKRGGFDILFANSCALLRVPLLARYVTLPTVLYLAEPYRTLYEALPRLPWAALPWPSHVKDLLKDVVRVQGLRIQVREEAHNAAAFDRILTNSFFSRESILRAYGLDAQVCYLGVDTTLFVDQNKPREDFVIGVGAFAPEKNIEAVMEAVSALPLPRPRLVWVGQTVNRRYLDAMQALARARGVVFDPRIKASDGELVDLLNRACMMVYAPHLEPFGLAPLEANACGTPVVAVAEGGVRETVVDGSNGLLVEHARALPAAVGRLLSDRAYAAQLGQNGRRLVNEQWSLAAAVERLQRKLLEVCNHPL